MLIDYSSADESLPPNHREREPVEKQAIRPPILSSREPLSEPESLVKEEIARLRRRLWRLRGRKSRITGLVFLIISAAFLVGAYLTRYLLFEATSILTLLLGVVFVFIGAESYVKVSVAEGAMISALVPLEAIMSKLDTNCRAIYLPQTSSRQQTRIFIPQEWIDVEALQDLASQGAEMEFGEKGILLPSLGEGLLHLYEEELGDFARMTFDYLAEWLPRLFTEGLQIAERMEIAWNGSEALVKLVDPVFKRTCQNPIIKGVCERLGCPVSSSIIGAVAKNTGRIVYFERCTYSVRSQLLLVAFRTGQVLRDKCPGELGNSK